jgi:hypothetical protein
VQGEPHAANDATGMWRQDRSEPWRGKRRGRMARPDEEHAKSREECARLIIYQSLHDPAQKPIYHPTLIGEAFFDRINLLLKA